MPAEKRAMPPTQTGYERLIQEERLHEDEDHALGLDYQDVDMSPPPAYRRTPQWEWRSISVLIGKAIIFSLAIWGTICLIKLVIHIVQAHVPVDCNCGNSIEEAKVRGCKYDAMATSWLPPQCRDDELANEFDHAGPGPNGEWGYFADRHGNVSYTLEEVGLLAANEANDDRGFWTTHEWHIAHCMFYWRKESRARLFGKSIIEKSFSGEYHTSHCRDIFLSCRPLQEINTLSHAGLNSDIQGA